MFQLFQKITAGEVFKRQLPVFSVSFITAEMFYKFGSFALECVAFLLTWYVLDAAVQAVTRTPKATKRPEDIYN